MKPTLPSILILFLVIPVFGQVYTPESVPNTKLVNNSYVSNPDHILTDAAVSRINYLLKDLEDRTTVQVAVVAVKSIGNADIFDFTQELFDLWKVGHSGKDNGMIILLAEDKRQIRFHTGYGLEGTLPDVVCKRIQMKYMVPLFKVEDYSAGMVSGVEEISTILSDPAYAEELRDSQQREAEGWWPFFIVALVAGSLAVLICYLVLNGRGKFKGSKKYSYRHNRYQQMALTKTQWLIEFAVLPAAILVAFNFVDAQNHVVASLAALYGYFVLVVIHKGIRMQPVIQGKLASKDYYGAVEVFQYYQTFWLVMAILLPLPMLLYFPIYLLRKKSYRNHPRNCEKCDSVMKKLDEKADDEYLSKGQVFEEEVGSVDYDVWKCTSCGSTRTWNYVNRFSRYTQCAKCHVRGMRLESDRTISSPSYTSTGTGEKTWKCKFCGHTRSETYTIAQLTRPSESSSGGGSYSSGSSSSSGGSWGGGSSGGGGATSSW